MIYKCTIYTWNSINYSHLMKFQYLFTIFRFPWVKKFNIFQHVLRFHTNFFSQKHLCNFKRKSAINILQIKVFCFEKSLYKFIIVNSTSRLSTSCHPHFNEYIKFHVNASWNFAVNIVKNAAK